MALLLPWLCAPHQVELKESWYEKLQRWADAREAYERKTSEDPLNFSWTLGRMRCQAAPRTTDYDGLCTLRLYSLRLYSLTMPHSPWP